MKRLSHLDFRTWDWRPVSIAVVVLALAFASWFTTWRYPTKSAEAECRERYAEARTHADTVREDAAGGGHATKAGPWNCGMLRKAGRL
jgi:hypothetical protein